MEIHYLNAPAGAGKTHIAIIKNAVALAMAGHRVLVAMPTKDLIEQTIKEMEQQGVKCVSVIYSGNDAENRNVVRRTIEKLRKPSIAGEIVFITHVCLNRLPYRGKLREWTLIIDEVPQVHKFFDVMIDDDAMLLLRHVKFSPSPWPGYQLAKFSKEPKNFLQAIVDQKKREKLLELAYSLKSPHTRVCVTEKSVEAVTSNQWNGKKFHAFGMILPSLIKAFDSTLIMSANFQNTLLHRMWSLNGVRFSPREDLQKQLSGLYKIPGR